MVSTLVSVDNYHHLVQMSNLRLFVRKSVLNPEIYNKVPAGVIIRYKRGTKFGPKAELMKALGEREP